MLKRLFFLLLLSGFSHLVFAQTEPDTAKLSVAKIDSISTLSLQKLDTTQLKINQSLDSLQSINNGITHLGDSLQLNKYNSKIDSIKASLTHKIDSLNLLQLPSKQYTQLLDSINQLGPIKNINDATARLTAFENKINDKVNKPFNTVEKKVNDKLSLMRSEGGADANLPSNLDLPGVDGQLPNTSMPSLDASLPSAETGINTDINGPQLPNLKENIPVMDDLGKVQEVMGQVGEVSGQIEGYSSDVKNIASGNIGEVEQLPDALEQQATKLGDLDDFQEQTQTLDEYKGMAGIGNDPKALKEKAIQQVPKLAKNHFAGQEAVLKEAMDKVSKYKSKYTELTSLKDVPKRKPNEMKGKPFIERLVPGITLQIQNSERVLLDYSPMLGYRISGRLTAGLGWNERVSIGKRVKVTLTDRIYGPRSYFSFKWKKGFSFRTDAEKMFTYVPPLFGSTGDPNQHDWVWSVFVGMKKDYQFVKRVRGNFQFMYNIYDDRNSSPYLNRLNVRMGFEFPMKKKQKKEKIENG